MGRVTVPPKVLPVRHSRFLVNRGVYATGELPTVHHRPAFVFNQVYTPYAFRTLKPYKIDRTP